VSEYFEFARTIHEQQGMGLGLSIAKRIAELWKGQLDVESTFGQGTTVVVTLPAAAPNQAHDITAKSDAPGL
jgi:signal transduction histidine kinase